MNLLLLFHADPLQAFGTPEQSSSPAGIDRRLRIIAEATAQKTGETVSQRDNDEESSRERCAGSNAYRENSLPDRTGISLRLITDLIKRNREVGG
jgi:hypothetical protein